MEILFTVVWDNTSGTVQVMFDDAVRSKLSVQAAAEITEHVNKVIGIVGNSMK